MDLLVASKLHQGCMTKETPMVEVATLDLGHDHKHLEEPHHGSSESVCKMTMAVVTVALEQLLGPAEAAATTTEVAMVHHLEPVLLRGSNRLLHRRLRAKTMVTTVNIKVTTRVAMAVQHLLRLLLDSRISCSSMASNLLHRHLMFQHHLPTMRHLHHPAMFLLRHHQREVNMVLLERVKAIEVQWGANGIGIAV